MILQAITLKISKIHIVLKIKSIKIIINNIQKILIYFY
jgi:hypothetical protein